MRKENILLIGIIVILLTGLIYSISGFFINSNDALNVKDSNKFIKKTSQGEVIIDLKPYFENGKLYVNIDVNTHTVDLSAYNLKELTLLEFDNIRTNPISAPILSGHHNNGQLIFDVGENLDRFKIRITGIEIQERVFEWP